MATGLEEAAEELNKFEKPKIEIPSLDDLKVKLDTEEIKANLAKVDSEELKNSGKDAIADAKALASKEERQKLRATGSAAFNGLVSGSIISNEGTGWTMIYNFNAIFFSIMAAVSLLSIVVAQFGVKIRKVLSCLHCLVCPVHTTMVIMALVYRFDAEGSKCAMRDNVYDAEGNSFL